MELGWHGQECPQAKENALAKTGCYFGTEWSNICPEDLAALSRSTTTIKRPAWPEGADWSDWRGCCVECKQCVLFRGLM